MTTTSKTKSRFKQVLSKLDARRLRTNNQQKCVDCLKPRSNKNELECKKCSCNEFYVPNYFTQSFCNISHFVMYKNGNIVEN